MSTTEIEKAIAAVRKFSEALEWSVDDSVRRLAPPDDPAVSITWTQGDLTHLAVQLRSGRVIRGVGAAKMEAIADAEARR